MMNKFIFITVVLFCFFVKTLLATSIVPYPNLGEMAKAAPIVVLVNALENVSINKDGITHYGTKVKVINAIKGAVNGQIMTIKEWKTSFTDQSISVIAGDLHLEAGQDYLLFLEEKEDGFLPTMLSHGVYQYIFKDNQHLMVPLSSHGIESFARPDGIATEPMYAHHLEPLMLMMKDVVTNTSTWDARKSMYHNNLVFDNQGVEDRAAPGHCVYFTATFAAGTKNTRWSGFPATTIRVRKSTVADVVCSAYSTMTDAAVSDLNTNYTGLNLSIGSNVTFLTSSCGAISTGITTFLNGLSDNPGARNIFVVYNDPCAEITDPGSSGGGFGGVLAVGGSRISSATQTFDGTTWYTSQFGYVIVNNGWSPSSAFFCGTAYPSFMPHELSHALSVDHIAPASGVSNMNPTCCNGITALDIACLDYAYPSAAFPIELSSFSGKKIGNSNQLSWKTATENQNRGFHIERSIDGIDFQKIGFVKT
jgi:hypothetical protein